MRNGRCETSLINALELLVYGMEVVEFGWKVFLVDCLL